MPKNPSDTPPEQGIAPRSEEAIMPRPKADLMPITTDAAPIEARSRLMSYLTYWGLAWRELSQIKGYRWMKVSGKVISFILAFTGVAVGSIVWALWPLLPPLAWLSIVLGVMVVASQVAIYLFGRFHDRITGELRKALPDKDERISRLATRAEFLSLALKSKQYEAERERDGYEHDISRLKSEREFLKSQLEERDRYKLFLVVDTDLHFAEPPDVWETFQSNAGLYLDTAGFPVDETEISIYTLTADLRILFENRGTDKVIIRTVRVSLLRKTSRGREKSIRTIVSSMDVRPITSAPLTLDGWPVEGLTITLPMLLHCQFELNARIGRRLNPNCFLRVSMDAMNQRPFDVDLNADWEKARNTDGTVPVTPRS